MRTGWIILLLMMVACGKNPDGTALQSDRFAAFAVSDDGHSAAYTMDGPSQSAADESSIEKCLHTDRARGQQCKVIARITQGCMAEATGTNTRHILNIGKGDTASKACANALQACKSNNGIDCYATSFGCMEGALVSLCALSDTPQAAANPKTTPAKASPRAKRSGPFGAIAVGRNGERSGTSFAHATQAEAEAAAEASCRSDGKSAAGDCAAKVWFKDACGALATGKNAAYGTGWAKSPAAACKWAIATCKDFGGVQCEGDIYSCSPRDEWGTCDGKLKAVH